MQQGRELTDDLIKSHTRGNVVDRIYAAVGHRSNHLMKILLCCIPATHQRTFLLMKRRMAESDIPFLQSDQYVPSSMRHVIERPVDGTQAAGAVNNHRR